MASGAADQLVRHLMLPRWMDEWLGCNSRTTLTGETELLGGKNSSQCHFPSILNFRTRCRWVVSFTFQPLYTRGKNPPYPLARTLGWPQRRHRSFRKATNLVTLPGIEPPACSLSLLLRSSTEIRLLGLYHRTATSSWHTVSFTLLDKPILYNTGPTFSNLLHKLAPSFSLISCCSAKQNSLVQNTKYHGSVALLHLQVNHFNPAHISS